MTKELKNKLMSAKDLDEVKTILDSAEGESFTVDDAEHIWKEIEYHRTKDDQELDPDELEAVSGGASRNWVTEGCAATCEENSRCWTNDYCCIWDVVYSCFHDACIDGKMHDYKDDIISGSNSSKVCTKCGKTTNRPVYVITQ